MVSPLSSGRIHISIQNSKPENSLNSTISFQRFLLFCPTYQSAPSAAQFGRVTAVAALARLGADRTELERATNVARQYGHAETVEWIEQFCSKADAAGDTTLPYQDS